MRSLALILTLAPAPVLFAQSSGPYQVTHTYTLGGDGGWDYIVPDPLNHRLFIGRQNRVMVVDDDTGTLLGEVTGIEGAHGTAVAEATGHGFATSGRDQSVVMFDLKTLKTLGQEFRRPRTPTRSSTTVPLTGCSRSTAMRTPRPSSTHRRHPDHRHRSRRQAWSTAHRPATERSKRISPTPTRSSRSTRRPRLCRGDGPPRRASNRWRWRSTPRIIDCSAGAEAA